MVKVENLYCQLFSCFTEPILADFLVCCYKAIQQLNGVEKNSVAISLMLSHNLTILAVTLFKNPPLIYIFLTLAAVRNLIKKGYLLKDND